MLALLNHGIRSVGHREAMPIRLRHYGAKSAVYVDAFMNVIRWDNPAKLYDRYSREAS